MATLDSVTKVASCGMKASANTSKNGCNSFARRSAAGIIHEKIGSSWKALLSTAATCERCARVARWMTGASEERVDMACDLSGSGSEGIERQVAWAN